MRIAVLTETEANESRVAATPDTVKKFKALGADVVVQAGAGLTSGVTDADYEAVGATIAASPGAAAEGADIVLLVRRPDSAVIEKHKRRCNRRRHHGSLRRAGCTGRDGRA